MKATRPKVLWAVLAVFVTAKVTASFRLPSPDTLPRCLDSAQVAFQTAQSPEGAVAVWNLLGGSRDNLAKIQYADFAFIAAYTFLFLVLAGVGRQRPIPSAMIAGKLLVVAAIVTAVADVGENVFTLRVVAALQRGVPELGVVTLMRECSLSKWAASGVTLILLWWVFLPSRRGSALYRLLALATATFFVLGVPPAPDSPASQPSVALVKTTGAANGV